MITAVDVLKEHQQQLDEDGVMVGVSRQALEEVLEYIVTLNNTFPAIQDTKPVWVAWSNTDLTEGRGHLFPLYVAESYEAAVRMGRRGSVQGSDCSVTEAVAVKVGNRWLIPGVIRPEIEEDKKLRAKREAREKAIENAKAAGLTDDDIDALVGK